MVQHYSTSINKKKTDNNKLRQTTTLKHCWSIHSCSLPYI